jgi:hypothetical protein
MYLDLKQFSVSDLKSIVKSFQIRGREVEIKNFKGKQYLAVYINKKAS